MSWFWFGLQLATGWLLWKAYQSNPSVESFQQFLRQQNLPATNREGPNWKSRISRFFSAASQSVSQSVVDAFKVYDYKLFTIMMMVDQKDHWYLGIFGHWYPLHALAASSGRQHANTFYQQLQSIIVQTGNPVQSTGVTNSGNNQNHSEAQQAEWYAEQLEQEATTCKNQRNHAQAASKYCEAAELFAKSANSEYQIAEAGRLFEESSRAYRLAGNQSHRAVDMQKRAAEWYDRFQLPSKAARAYETLLTHMKQDHQQTLFQSLQQQQTQSSKQNGERRKTMEMDFIRNGVNLERRCAEQFDLAEDPRASNHWKVYAVFSTRLENYTDALLAWSKLVLGPHIHPPLPTILDESLLAYGLVLLCIQDYVGFRHFTSTESTSSENTSNSSGPRPTLSLFPQFMGTPHHALLMTAFQSINENDRSLLNQGIYDFLKRSYGYGNPVDLEQDHEPVPDCSELTATWFRFVIHELRQSIAPLEGGDASHEQQLT